MTRTELLAFWPGHGEVGLRLPVGVVGREIDMAIALAGELDDPLDVVLRTARPGGRRMISRRSARFLLRIEALIAFGLRRRGRPCIIALRCWLASREPATRAATFCSSSIFQAMKSSMSGWSTSTDHHLGGAPRRAARLDGAGGAVADLEEATSGPTTCRRPTGARLRRAGARSWSRCRSRT